MIGFAKRNLKVFFKDKTAVFFSLLAVLIIIGLYALFLGNVMSEGMGHIEGARNLTDTWIMAGLLAVTSFTTTMGAFGVMVDDKKRKIDRDFIASPIKTKSIVSGYILSSVIIGIIMSLVAFVVSEVYIISSGGKLIEFVTFIKVLLLIVLSTITNTSIILFLVSFLKSANAFATASTVIGTLIGFLTGIYLPVGNLPASVQWIVKIFPVSHTAALFRQLIMEKPLEKAFANAPDSAVSNFKETMGITYKFGETEITPIISILIILATAILFYILSVIRLSKKSK